MMDADKYLIYRNKMLRRDGSLRDCINLLEEQSPTDAVEFVKDWRDNNIPSRKKKFEQIFGLSIEDMFPLGVPCTKPIDWWFEEYDGPQKE